MNADRALRPSLKHNVLVIMLIRNAICSFLQDIASDFLCAIELRASSVFIYISFLVFGGREALAELQVRTGLHSPQAQCRFDFVPR